MAYAGIRVAPCHYRQGAPFCQLSCRYLSTSACSRRSSSFHVANCSAMKKCPSTLHYLLLLTLPMFATAFAQGPSPLWNPRAARPLENYDNPPEYIYRLETSPRMISPH